MKSFFLIAAFIGLFFSLTAEEFPYDEVKDLRIVKLLPNTDFPLAIDPDLPKNFTVVPVDDNANLLAGVIWGERKDAKNFLKNPPKNKSTVIVVRYSENVSQQSLFENADALKYEIEQGGFSNVELKRYSWGSYPVVAVQGTMEGKEIHVAWVGLNVDADLVLLFNLIYPSSQSKPTSKQLKMWNDFLENTHQLPEREFLLVNGIDLNENYTVLAYKKAEIKAFAEEKIENEEALIVVNPLTPHTSFNIKKVSKTFLGTQWNHGKPCVKIEGEMTHVDGNLTDILETTVTVLLKSVNQFSPELEKLKDKENTAAWSGKLSVYENSVGSDSQSSLKEEN